MKHKLLIILIFFSFRSIGQNIIGGTDAMQGQFPWMAELIFFETDHLCGGTIIDPHWVLTAGHCAATGFGDGFVVVANSIDYRTGLNLAEAELLDVDTVFFHPSYTGEGVDLALIYLGTPASTEPVELISPADNAALATGDPALTMGWGLHGPNLDTVADTLQIAEVLLFDYDSCKSMYTNADNQFFELNGTPNLICAGYFEGNPAAGAGSGDSGGPLLVNIDNTWKQIGVVYGGELAYATSEYPGVYTSILGNLDWIENQMESYPSPVSLAPTETKAIKLKHVLTPEELILYVDQLNLNTDYYCSIYDQLGRRIARQKFNNFDRELRFDVSALQGIYWLQVQAMDGSSLFNKAITLLK